MPRKKSKMLGKTSLSEARGKLIFVTTAGQFLLRIIKVKTHLQLHSEQRGPEKGTEDSGPTERGTHTAGRCWASQSNAASGSDLKLLFLRALEAGRGIRVAPGENAPGLQSATFARCPRTWGQLGRQTDRQREGENSGLCSQGH